MNDEPGDIAARLNTVKTCYRWASANAGAIDERDHVRVGGLDVDVG